MNAQPKLSPTHFNAAPKITTPTPLFGVPSTNLERELQQMAEVRDLRKKVLKLSKQLKEANREKHFLEVQLAASHAIASNVFANNCDLRKELERLPKNDKTWSFIEENDLSEEEKDHLNAALSDEEIEFLDEVSVKIFIGAGANRKVSKTQRKKAVEILSAVSVRFSEVAIFKDATAKEAGVDCLSDEFDHVIFLNCPGFAEIIPEEKLKEMKKSLKVVSGKNLNVVNFLRKIAAYHKRASKQK